MNTKFNWLNEPFIKQLVTVLGSDNIRFVGGAVRDSLIGRPIHDIDAATSLLPDEVIKRLKEASISVIPTGLSHGTVTAYSKEVSVEITTLRVDTETDGRRAKVTYTSDWSLDASRRDFTMNAIYVDNVGNCFDPFNGQKDLANGRVVFIGNAEDRIKEDALRILRFFRFNAWFSLGGMNEEGLNACKQHQNLISNLSIERIRDEFIKLLRAPNPVAVLMAMFESRMITEFLPDFKILDRNEAQTRLENLVQIEGEFTASVNPLARLVCLYGLQYGEYKKWGRKFKLSKKQINLLIQTYRANNLFNKMVSQYKNILLTHQMLIYRFGYDVYQLFYFVNASQDIEFERDLSFFKKMQTWDVPVFPIRGNDLIERGWTQGPDIAKALSLLENSWIESSFSLTKEQLILDVLSYPLK